jgi:hypothetical protein
VANEEICEICGKVFKNPQSTREAHGRGLGNPEKTHLKIKAQAE